MSRLLVSADKIIFQTSTIVRNPTHQDSHHSGLSPKPATSLPIQKVVMRQKKKKPTVETHFRRSMGSTFETPVLKKRPATIAYSEVSCHEIN